jgi:hypothetical protein
MQQLINSLEQRLGISPEKAQEAVTHVMDFLKSKLPSGLHEHLDSAANGQNLNDGDGGGLLGKLGGMFGK